MGTSLGYARWKAALAASAAGAAVATVAVVSCCFALACAAGKQPEGGTGAGGNVDWSTSAQGAGGIGEGGATSTGGSGGSLAAGGTRGIGGGGEGGMATGGEGGAMAAHALVVAGSPSELFAARYEDGKAWSTKSYSNASFTTSTHAIGLAMTSDANGVRATAVFRDGAMGDLDYIFHAMGTWVGPAGVSASVTTRGAPSVIGVAGDAHVVFQGDDFNHYFASYSGALWSPSAEPVKPSGSDQSFGPAPACIAAIGAELVIAFAGNDGALYTQSRTAGTWAVGEQHSGSATQLAPAITALSANAELLVAYVRSSDGKLMFATRTAGKWSAHQVVEDNSFTAEPPALAPLAGGGALLAFRGLDGKGYVTRYTPSQAEPWSTPDPIASPNVSIASAPAVAPGIGTAEAELIYVDGTSGGLFHTRLVSGAWTAPTAVGGAGLVHVALASAP